MCVSPSLADSENASLLTEDCPSSLCRLSDVIFRAGRILSNVASPFEMSGFEITVEAEELNHGLALPERADLSRR